MRREALMSLTRPYTTNMHDPRRRSPHELNCGRATGHPESNREGNDSDACSRDAGDAGPRQRGQRRENRAQPCAVRHARGAGSKLSNQAKPASGRPPALATQPHSQSGHCRGRRHSGCAPWPCTWRAQHADRPPKPVDWGASKSWRCARIPPQGSPGATCDGRQLLQAAAGGRRVVAVRARQAVCAFGAMPGAQRPAEHHLGPRGLASEAAPGNHWRNERRLGEVAKTRAPDVDLIGREDLRKQARLQGSREVLGRGRAPHVHVDVQAEVQRGHRDETPAASLQRSLELERGPAPPRLCRQRLLSEELVLCHARPLQVAVQAEDEMEALAGDVSSQGVRLPRTELRGQNVDTVDIIGHMSGASSISCGGFRTSGAGGCTVWVSGVTWTAASETSLELSIAP
eukprot:CAMPEP_0176253742 /NCGR_PEP_ID=MMETSP0121_2-20121125/36174_1 /TAXON_ID=160619 /ORGANISM="Kryptoperidinium foliaceum, Strain CCMP 1326" /LENGTH=400 /DNA_ID=CAMNT_0017593531 /DNA_START=46 /DNA_END=1250 /DNA_ORIENTATION=+